MAYLYVNSHGRPVTANSYSGSAMFGECARKYFYNRKQGYREKVINAAREFGTAWEEALRYYHEWLDPVAAAAEWERLWTEQKSADLKYKDSESWEEMCHQGAELLRLYIARLPDLPIIDPRFQLNYRKELFPGTEYAGLEDQSYVDMQVDGIEDHTLLPPATHPGPRSLIVDIKTSGRRYPQDARLLRLDPQLRRYSWHTGIETVAFLVGVRKSRKLDRGDVVTLVEDTFKWKLGDTPTVFSIGEAGEIYLMTREAYEQYMLDQKGVRGKALGALKEKVQAELRDSWAARSSVTNQEIQFLVTTLSDAEREQTGTVVGHETLQIYEAEQNDYFPQRPGIRFPNNHCTFCPYLGLCIDDQNLIDQKLVNISALPVEPDWLDAMLEDE